MELTSAIEVKNTKEKLRRLQQLYDERVRDPDPREHAQQLTLHSLKKLINQLTEEILRYECKHKVG